MDAGRNPHAVIAGSRAADVKGRRIPVTTGSHSIDSDQFGPLRRNEVPYAGLKRDPLAVPSGQAINAVHGGGRYHASGIA